MLSQYSLKERKVVLFKGVLWEFLCHQAQNWCSDNFGLIAKNNSVWFPGFAPGTYIVSWPQSLPPLYPPHISGYQALPCSVSTFLRYWASVSNTGLATGTLLLGQPFLMTPAGPLFWVPHPARQHHLPPAAGALGVRLS